MGYGERFGSLTGSVRDEQDECFGFLATGCLSNLNVENRCCLAALRSQLLSRSLLFLAADEMQI